MSISGIYGTVYKIEDIVRAAFPNSLVRNVRVLDGQDVLVIFGEAKAATSPAPVTVETAKVEAPVAAAPAAPEKRKPGRPKKAPAAAPPAAAAPAPAPVAKAAPAKPAAKATPAKTAPKAKGKKLSTDECLEQAFTNGNGTASVVDTVALGANRNALNALIHRKLKAGEIERVARGVYKRK